MSVLLRGVRLYGEGERVDVLVDSPGREGQIAQIGAGLEIPDYADVIDAPGTCCYPDWSTCTPTCASPAANMLRISKPARRQLLWVATRRCSRWLTPPRSPTVRWSPTTSGTVANRSAWSTCTPSVRSPSGWPEPSSPRWA